MIASDQTVTSWGRLSGGSARVVALWDRGDLAEVLTRSSLPGTVYGAGRSYGDVCLNPGGTVWSTRALDRFVSFDAQTGVLECEAGVTLDEILRIVVPHGWFLPVVPGTQFVTVGGAIANDIHGKNHHRRGTFGQHVKQFFLHRTDGSAIRCGPAEQTNWFCATVGGLGLTGVISRATIQLKRVPGAWLDTESIAFGSLDEFFEIAAASDQDWEHTVAWIDCAARGRQAGRGVFFRGNHANSSAASTWRRRARRIAVTPPLSLVNGLSLRVFNQCYFHLHRARAGRRPQHYQPFFFPLDNLLDWNKLYGPHGFYQYQSVVPTHNARSATREMLAAISGAGMGSFLAVLKTLGANRSPGMLSFPMPGTTLALDFPNRGKETHLLFARLDAIVSEAGGRIYPAKDARMPRELFEKGYPRIEEFARYRDPGISSAMSRRLLGS